MARDVYRSRLEKPMDEDALRFLSSLREDHEIFLEDLRGSEAHVIMLYEKRIIGGEDARRILKALEDLRRDWINRRIKLPEEGFEDVHEFIEAYLIERLGIEIGGKLHTGRSRNDQVSLDIRLRLRKLLIDLWRACIDLAEAMLRRAEECKDKMMILYTHLQHAQVGLLSHYILAHLDHLLRDIERIRGCYRRTNLSPLGASASAGSTLPLDRLRVAELLGFDGLVENSLDAVSSRDFALEALAASAILMINLSRISEDLIIWSSKEFDYIELPDELASPSSIMPHKKNPCILELIRAKAGKVCGNLISSLMIMKGSPTGYNRDLQEGKPPIWKAFRETISSVRMLEKVFQKIAFKEDRMREKVLESYAPAIELAEALIKSSNLSLREAHKLVGEFIKRIYEAEKTLKEADPDLLKKLAKEILGKEVKIDQRIYERSIDPEKAYRERRTIGSSSPAEISRMIEERRRAIEDEKRSLEEVVKRLEESEKRIERTIQGILGNQAQSRA